MTIMTVKKSWLLIHLETLKFSKIYFFRLQSMVSEYSVSLLHSLRACATLDCLISLALTAREYSWCRPLLVNESVIDIDGSRHPISELFSSTKFVSNPIRFLCYFFQGIKFWLIFGWSSELTFFLINRGFFSGLVVFRQKWKYSLDPMLQAKVFI